MTDTLPDYSDRGRNDSIAGVQDMSELAARLKSIHTFDRRGEIVWMDDFENGGGKWELEGVGVGNSETISATTSRNGDSSVKLVTGNTITREAHMSKRLTYPAITNHGLEFSFTYGVDLDYIDAYFYIFDGANLHQFSIRYDQTNRRVQYYDDAGNWVNTGITFEEILSMPVFTSTKLVVDVNADEYVRLLYGSEEFNMAGIAPRVTVNATEPQIFIRIVAYSTAGNNATVYIDDVIVTQNEA